MPLVRIIRNWQWPELLQQTPGGSGVWEGIRFTEENTRDCDLCVVLNHPGPEGSPAIPPANVLRVVQEPPIEFFKPWHANPDYSSATFTCDPERRGREYVRSHPMVPWHLNRGYDFLAATPVPEKRAGLSWVTTTKTILPGHRQRMEFLTAARTAIPGLELLGTRVIHITNPAAREENQRRQQELGFASVEDKWAAVAPYRYSLAVENFSGPDYWTEKLADCFLAWTLPIYHGCPNLEEYFPPESFIRIDIDHPREAIETILRTLREDPWEKRLEAIAEARRRVLNEHQLFPVLARHCHSIRAAAWGSGESGPMIDRPKISVVVCTHNREKLLPACLESLANQTLPADAFEVLVVDNNSSDLTREAVSRFTASHPGFRYLFEPRAGLSHARNLGVLHSRAGHVAFIDDDSIADRGWLEEARKIIEEKNPDIFGGAVRPAFSPDRPEWLKEEYATRGHRGQSGWIDSGFLIGTNIFFRKSLLRDYGGFDPRLGMRGDRLGYHEETQLVLRAFREKKAVYFSRDLMVTETIPEYKESLAYYLYAKYRAGADGLDLWTPSDSQAEVRELLAVIRKTMEAFDAALTRRDRSRYPRPENYLIETGVVQNFFTIGLMTEFFLRRADPGEAESGVETVLDDTKT